MSFKVLWNQNALDSLKALDKPLRRRIFEKVENYLSQDPLHLGAPLKENMAGLYRYRCGNYRVIYAVDIEKKELMVLDAGHRKEIYRS